MSGHQKLIFGMVVLIGLFLSGAAPAEPRTALVIGNAAYADKPLPNPVNAARDMAKALEGMGFTVMLRENLEKRATEEAISEFSGRLQQQGGVGLFFFNGHGAQVDGHNYLVPIGATIHSKADIAYETVDAGRLLDHMEAAGNNINIVILDACRADPFGRNLPPAMGGSLGLGLAPMDAPAGSIIAYATSPGKVAESSYDRHSPYTAALLAEMSTPGLSIEQVFKRVRNRVKQATNNRQIPWESTSLMGDFYFVAPQTSHSSSSKNNVFRDTLQDGSQGPEMVKIRGGHFLMGSPADEKGREKDERQHEVSVADFTIGKYEVTVGQFESFVKATQYETEAEKSNGCYYWTGSEWKQDAGKTWRNPGFSQTDEHSVVCVSWNRLVPK